jgi:N-sulfoglucosamine sulfohydrolase
MYRLFLTVITCLLVLRAIPALSDERPNILFFFVDDLGRYAGVYSDPDRPSLNDLVKTPSFDRIGREGVIFNNAFVPVASCGPCRASLATGRYFWNCGSGAFLNGKASDWKGTPNPLLSLPTFGDRLRDGGYFVQRSVKTFRFTPDRPTPAMRKIRPTPYQRYGLYVGTAENKAERKRRHDETLAHPRTEMRRVLAHGTGKPFFFVYGSINVHRPYTPDSGRKLWGIEPDRLKGLIPKFLPDSHDVRRDFSDYLGEVQAADAMLGVMLAELESAGQLDNTMVIVSGDHGIPGVPRGKTTCYDLGTRVPLLVRWPKGIRPGRRVDDFVSIMDIGPTLMELSQAQSLPTDGRSFLRQLTSRESGWIDPLRKEVVIGRELHFHDARVGNVPYPMRAIRNPKHLYIRNFKPGRWPMGNPYEAAEIVSPGELYDLGRNTVPAYRDLDGSLTKAYLMSQRDDDQEGRFLALTLNRRPSEELYLIGQDPDQLKNLADDPVHRPALERLRSRIDAVMTQSQDPRLTDAFDRAPWVTGQ